MKISKRIREFAALTLKKISRRHRASAQLIVQGKRLDRRGRSMQRREDAMDLREEDFTSREKLTLAGNAAKMMRDNDHLRQANEHLVVATIRAQAMTEELEIAQDKMGRMVRHDPLTNLPNRILLMERLKSDISMAKRHRTKLAILFIDLDRFKAINDSLGHTIGDQLLKAVAHRLLECVRGNDTVSRHGGDEFIVLLTEIHDEKAVADFSERLCASIAAPYMLAEQRLFIGATIGISFYPDDGTDPETLLHNADVAMYDAKKSGRNRFHFFKQEMNLRAIERQRVESDLHSALAREEFELYYQPQVDLATGCIVGAEALIRWRHPERGLLSPSVFMSIAEACGAIVAIGRWVLHEACRQAQAWSVAGAPLPILSVNVSALEFSEIKFLDNVLDILRDTGFPPASLELELTETVLMRDVDQTLVILQKLKSIGIKIAIDDFGTGYSSLSYLNQFPIDTLKIDQSFVSRISLHNDNDVLVKSIIGLGENLNCRVIAEGIETSAQAQFLEKNQCSVGQGFFIAKPLNAKDFGIVLENGVHPNFSMPHGIHGAG